MSIAGLFVLVIGVILAIALHEIGHLVPAKLFGVKVPKYFIGFGPTLFSRTFRGTEYGVKAIPLGGFVQLSGMYAPAKDGVVLTNRKGQLTLAEEARRVSAEQIEPGEEEHAFYRLSVPKKLAVMFGGPFVNLLIALALSVVLLVGIGAPALLNQVGAIPACVSASECSDADPVTPAETAGLRPGDTILSWGGTPTQSWTDVQQAISSGTASPTEVTVDRDGDTISLTVTPVMLERPVVDEDGQVVLENGEELTQVLPYVGIAPAIGLERQSITAVPGYIGDMLWRTAGVIVRLPQQLWSLTTDFVTGQERDQSSIVGIIGVAQVAGQITGADIDGYSATEKTADLINLLIALNVSLFAFNMLPLLPLDGGHITGALYEGARRRWAAMRGRPDPGPADTARLMPLSYAVAGAFILMTVILIVVDIFNPITLY
ncbi:M50 family metallopeptidase [Flaviflexus equikiangi]|uniref:Site-2 protease family protein n=1 Tax=Flaviflexus equikiangi TaxID=2758573 RepID=A0ABS2TGE9_9ACTO|nr:site-2 protease family protein [Flaviflexus equikiangi]MBM9433707.1 site-2 protease family protein [Flaviflexus equikiangi]